MMTEIAAIVSDLVIDEGINRRMNFLFDDLTKVFWVWRIIFLGF